jgi:hypothetical protein
MSICSNGFPEDGRAAGVKTHQGKPSSPALPEPLVVKPKVAWRLLGCSHTYGYDLLAAGELDSFKDGKARKITMASIKARIARQLEATKTTAV